MYRIRGVGDFESSLTSIAAVPGQFACESLPSICAPLATATGSYSMATLILGGAIWAAGFIAARGLLKRGKR
jgi:hypothetical protein